MKRTDVTVTINNERANIQHDNVTKLAVGYRVIYIEYLENDELRIRAYGRHEFDTVTVLSAQNGISTFVLRGEEFKRIDATFPVSEDPIPYEENDTNEEDAI